MAEKIEVRFVASDQASKTVDDINKKLTAINTPAVRLRRSLGRLADDAGMRGLNRSLQDAADSSARIFANIGRAGPALAAFAGTAGLALAMRQAGAYGTTLQFASRQAGAGVGALQRLGNAAEISGGSFEGAVGSMAELNRNMQLMAHGGRADEKFVAAAMAMHINLRGANGQMRSTADVMDEALHKLARMKNAQQQLYFGNALLGSSFQTTLWPAVSQGTKALDEYLTAAKSMVNITPEQAEALRQSQVEMRRLGSDLQALIYGALGDFAPAVTKNVKAISDWIEKSQQQAEAITKVGMAVTALAAVKAPVWLLRLLGLESAATTTSAAAGALTAILSWAYATRIAPTQSEADDRAPYGGLSLAQRFPNLIVSPKHLSPPQSGTNRAAVMEETRRFWKSKGFTDAQVAGILAGGPAAESNFNPSLWGDNGTSYGLYQHHADRLKGMFWRYGMRPSVQQQNEYAWDELNDPQNSNLLSSLRATKSDYEMARRWSLGFERPAGGEATAEARARDAHLFLSPKSETVLRGGANLKIRIDGAPPGTRVSSETWGNIFDGAPKTVMPLPAGGGPPQ